MTNPPGIKKIWKNLDWKSKEEKQAFFNKYFKKSDIVTDNNKEVLGEFKTRIVSFIEDGKIKENDKERSITMQDVIERIKGAE